MDPVGGVAGLDEAAAARSKHSGGMGLVDHEDGAVASGDRGEIGKRCDRAIHREQTVGDDQPAPRRLGRQEAFEGGDVAVGKDGNRRARQPAAVDDACVVALVAENDVAGANERRDRGRVGGESRGKEERVAGAEKIRQRRLEGRVGGGVAAHQRARPGTESLRAGSARGGLRQPDIAG